MPHQSLPKSTSRQKVTINKLFLALYTILVSPVLSILGAGMGGIGGCRYSRSCSLYTADAINHYGVRRGVMMGLRRILHCHPWGSISTDEE